MTSRRSPVNDEPDLFDVLDEIENGPPPCPHVYAVGSKGGDGWQHELNPKSAYYLEWVHSDPACLRSAHPGSYRQEI